MSRGGQRLVSWGSLVRNSLCYGGGPVRNASCHGSRSVRNALCPRSAFCAWGGPAQCGAAGCVHNAWCRGSGFVRNASCHRGGPVLNALCGAVLCATRRVTGAGLCQRLVRGGPWHFKVPWPPTLYSWEVHTVKKYQPRFEPKSFGLWAQCASHCATLTLACREASKSLSIFRGFFKIFLQTRPHDTTRCVTGAGARTTRCVVGAGLCATRRVTGAGLCATRCVIAGLVAQRVVLRGRVCKKQKKSLKNCNGFWSFISNQGQIGTVASVLGS